MKIAVFCVSLSAFGLALLGPSITLAQSSAKQTPTRSIEVKKMFGYYDMYLRLPPQDRDGFRMGYMLNARDGGVRPQFTYVLGAVRTPVQVAPNGKILTMPDATMFRDGRVEIAAGQPSGSVSMDLEAIIPLSRSISVADASNPVNDYAAAVGRAGPLSLLAPKLPAILFKGGSGGQAVFADGRRVALPSAPGGVRFQPNTPAMRGAVSLAFATPPTAAEFAR